MATNYKDDPAFAFAMYASTASTIAVAALRNAGILDDQIIQSLVQNLTMCRTIAGNEPKLIEHAEHLTDMLLEAGQQK